MVVATPLQLSRALRAECRLAMVRGIDWQAPLDTVRAHVPSLWSQVSDTQRRQFVRHLRPWWESHRHRSPPRRHLARASAGRRSAAHPRRDLATGRAFGRSSSSLLLRHRGEQGRAAVRARLAVGVNPDRDQPMPIASGSRLFHHRSLNNLGCVRRSVHERSEQ